MRHKLKVISTLVLLLVVSTFQAQSDAEVFKTLYKNALTKGKSYEWLEHLSNQIGGRLSGSYNAEKAVTYTKAALDSLGLSKTWLQPVRVPKWVRGAKAYAYVESRAGKTTPVTICALGGSVATPGLGLKANVVEVDSLEALKALGTAQIKGKIVFFNHSMQEDVMDTFKAYKAGVSLVHKGAVEAVKYGAVGVIVRSLTLRQDENPHTERITYGDLSLEKRIPAAAISTKGADLLSSLLKLEPTASFYFRQHCKQLKDVQSYNVIGELKGSTYPNEYILIGAHLDSWDLGDGTHDNGAGVVQAMDVLRLFKECGIKPKRSIRVVLFADKEQRLSGAKVYAAKAKNNKVRHIFALESDVGGFAPSGFYFNCNTENLKQVLSWKPLFSPYLVHNLETGFAGANINLIKTSKNVLAGLRTDSQRYFDYHHASSDSFATVNKRELELGAATMAALVYLYDQYGIK